ICQLAEHIPNSILLKVLYCHYNSISTTCSSPRLRVQLFSCQTRLQISARFM
ncbi:hypothetical protein ABKV19_009177, partial [Rosa sericea]